MISCSFQYFSVIPGQWEDDNERQYDGTSLKEGKTSVSGNQTWNRQTSRPALKPLRYQGSSTESYVQAVSTYPILLYLNLQVVYIETFFMVFDLSM